MNVTFMDELTETQKAIVELIARYQKENDGWYPAIRDILDYHDCPVSSTSVINYNFIRLEKLDYIERRPMRPTVRLSRKAMRELRYIRKHPKKHLMLSKYNPSYSTR